MMLLIAIRLVVSLVFAQMLRSLNVVNHEGDKNNIGVGKERIRKKVRNFFFIPEGTKWVYRGRDRTGRMIFLPILPNANPSILACINAPEDKEGKQTCAENIQTKSANTTWLTIPPLMLSGLTPFITTLHNAKGKNAIGAAWFALNKKLTKIMQLVQDCMDLNVPDSITICELMGFHVHGKGGSHPQAFEGFPGTVSGTSDIMALVSGEGGCYSWRLWNTARTSFVILDPTTVAHCTIGGQIPNSVISISYNVILGETTIYQSPIINVETKL